MHRYLSILLLLGSAEVLQSAFANAGIIQYSWYGLVLPKVTDGDDPWELSVLGNNFELLVGFSSSAFDVFEQNIEVSAFEVEFAELTVGATEILFVGPAFIEFNDNVANRFDLITFAGYFKHLGNVIEFGTALVLPLDTIHLSEMIERPSVFNSRRTIDRSAMGVPGPYTGVVGTGTPVNVFIPETQTIIMVLVLALSHVLTRP